MEHCSRQWPQGVGVPNNSSINKPTVQTSSSNNNGDRNKKMTRPSKEQALNCPRCNSLNTKFCYYNNYSLSQPRYFCKTCRRYWTQGGSLRNVPVGGGSRKNKRPSSSTLPSPPPPLPSSSKNYMNKLFPPINYFPNQSPRLAAFHEAHDLNPSYRPQVPPSAPTTGNDSANADVVPRGLRLMMMGPNYMPDLPFSSGCVFPSHLLDFKPSITSSSSTLDFSLAHINHGNSGNNYGGVDVDGYGSLIQLGLQEGGGGEARVLFPIKDPKQAMSSNTTGDHQQFEQNKELLRQGAGADSSSTGFWNHDMLLGRSTSGIHSSHQIQ